MRTFALNGRRIDAYTVEIRGLQQHANADNRVRADRRALRTSLRTTAKRGYLMFIRLSQPPYLFISYPLLLEVQFNIHLIFDF
jgi:hypothetical protein